MSGRGIWRLTSVYLEGSPTYGREEAKKELQERFKAVDEAIDGLKSFVRELIPKRSRRWIG